MRLALVCPYSWSRPGGVQKHVREFALELRARAVDVDVVAPADAPVDLPGFVGVGRSVGIRDAGSIVPVALGPGAVARTAAALRRDRYDLVHVHEPVIPAVSLTAVFAARAPVVGTFHIFAGSARWYRPFAPVCRRALARLSARIAVSELAANHVARTCRGDYRVIPNGIDVDALAAHAGPRDGTRLLFVGRAEPRKGLPVLLDAFARLPTLATLDLVGVSPAELAHAGVALQPGAAARVRAHGRVSDEERNRLLGRADVLCVPSLENESFGIVLLEGMAAGAVVVASALPAYARLLPEPAGRLVPPGDADALAGALAELLADGALRARLAAAAREEARRYDWPRVADEILAVYEDVLARAVTGERRWPEVA